MVNASDSQPQDCGFESRQSLWLIKNRPTWATGNDNGASVHSAVNNGKWVPSDHGDRQRWQLYLGYPWRLEACKWVYAPQGVEQVTDVTGLLGVIICKALWARFLLFNMAVNGDRIIKCVISSKLLAVERNGPTFGPQVYAISVYRVLLSVNCYKFSLGFLG